MTIPSIMTSQQVIKDLISGGSVTKILDFGQHAYADTFVSQEQYNLSEPVFPLQIFMNPETGSIQLGYVSHAEDRYNLYSYSYTCSNSKTARDHWDEYAATIKSKFNTQGLVVEIGSNDGYLIGQFNNTKAIGVDTSASMCELAKARGVETINALFGSDVGSAIEIAHGPAQVILANNVFNHSNDPVSFARAVADLLADDGVFVFEVPYWKWMVNNGKFPDMVYHEHPTYFTVKMAQNILASAGLTIEDYELVDYHGCSLRIVARHGTDIASKVSDAIAQETDQGLFDPVFYELLQKQLEQQRSAWLADFYELKHKNPEAVIIGVGAAAKANTWLNFYGLNKTHLCCITDSSEFKQGKYTPLSRIPILSDNEFAKYEHPYALILSWNISEGLKKALLNINPNTRFISQ